MKLFYLFFTVPVTVLACEGECISGITTEFLVRYRTPINKVLENLVSTHLGSVHFFTPAFPVKPDRQQTYPPNYTT